MIDKEELCRQIRMIYPDIGICGINLDAEYDGKTQRWVVFLKKDNKQLKTYLEPGDVEFCLLGKECLNLAIEINQLKDSIERMPGYTPVENREKAPEKSACAKAPEFVEHYRLGDEDPPCNDGRAGDA